MYIVAGFRMLFNCGIDISIGSGLKKTAESGRKFRDNFTFLDLFQTFFKELCDIIGLENFLLSLSQS